MNQRKRNVLFIIILIVLSGCAFIFYKNLKKKNVQDTYPYLLSENDTILESNTKEGMTIKDAYGNEWVWIVVPKSKVFLTTKQEQDYENIEKDIKEYAKEYSKEDYEDFLEKEEYITLKNKTLSSIYQYGGFWISRYEVGTTEIRNNKNMPTTEPFSQANLYVYNYVTFSQSEEISSHISNQKYNSHLLFGFQCDLVCKFIEENGFQQNKEKITKEMILGNSNSWGNYYSSFFPLDRGFYSENNGNNYYDISTIKEKKAYQNLLLTTGASERNKTCNIYDFAGNISEWILEYPKNEKKWNVIRDGSFYFNYGGNDPANGRYQLNANSSSSSYGFRIMIIK